MISAMEFSACVPKTLMINFGKVRRIGFRK